MAKAPVLQRGRVVLTPGPGAARVQIGVNAWRLRPLALRHRRAAEEEGTAEAST